MRGDDQRQNHIFSYLSPEARVRKDHPLRPIRAIVDQMLSQLSRFARAGTAVWNAKLALGSRQDLIESG